jgi:hypothetical protein
MPGTVETPSRLPGPACPDNDTLGRFLAGRLTDAEAEPLEQHLEGCLSCLDRLGGLSANDRAWHEIGAWSAADEPETVRTLIRRLCQPAAELSAPASLDTPADIRPRQPSSLPIQLGRYRVCRALGAGGMGTVYLADDPELGRPVAVKVPQFTGTPEARTVARQRFLREARAAAAVRHPHVCPIYDVGEHEGTPYVVMAFIEGRSLAERLRQAGSFADPRAAAALAVQMAEGLAAVHDRGLIHRDLKPANVLLDAAGDAFLSDFGLARWLDDADHLTTFGTLLGTPAYMAPEQIDGPRRFGPVTPRTDLYSLGVVLYEMLTGRRPFAAESRLQLLHRIVHDPPAPPRQLQPDLDPALEAVVLNAMARQPQDRYADARELAAALTGWLSGETVTGDVARPQLQPSARATAVPAVPSREDTADTAVAHARRRTVFLATGLLVAALALGLSFLTPLHRTPTAPVGPDARPLSGWIDVRVWKREHLEGPGRFLGAGVLPLQADDEVRVEAKLNRPAYLYVVWISSLGKPLPLYPWKADAKIPEHDRWILPATEHKIDGLIVPETPGSRWPMRQDDPRGMETLLLLARDAPWPRDVDLRRLLSGLPRAAVQHPAAAVWFRNWQVVFDEPQRAPNLFDERRPGEPVLRMQEELRERLGKYCGYSRAVSFANAGQ